MATIRVVYSEEPPFPASDQHPDARRYEVAGHWVDAIGGKPSESEIKAFLKPPKTADFTLEDLNKQLADLQKKFDSLSKK